MTGMNKYDEKNKRRMRRRNHIARDLRQNKYRQRIKPTKKKNEDWDEDDEYFS